MMPVGTVRFPSFNSTPAAFSMVGLTEAPVWSVAYRKMSISGTFTYTCSTRKLAPPMAPVLSSASAGAAHSTAHSSTTSAAASLRRMFMAVPPFYVQSKRRSALSADTGR